MRGDLRIESQLGRDTEVYVGLPPHPGDEVSALAP